MKGFWAGLRVVGICLLLLGWVTIAGAQSEFSGFGAEEELLSSPKFTTHFTVQLTQAKVRYEEHASLTNTNSSWDGWMTRGDFLLTSYYERDSGNDLGVEIGFGVFRTTTDEENGWETINQKNDTDFNGWELELGIGWTHDFEGLWEVKQVVSYGHRIIEFDRRNFVIVTGGDSGPVSDEYSIDYLRYSPHFTAKVKEAWSLSFNPGLAYVVRNEVRKSSPDVSIEGEGGVIANIEALLNYQFTEGFTGYMGVLGEWQYLEGNTIDGDEWPDNDLFTYGLKVGLVFAL